MAINESQQHNVEFTAADNMKPCFLTLTCGAELRFAINNLTVDNTSYSLSLQIVGIRLSPSHTGSINIRRSHLISDTTEKSITNIIKIQLQK